MAIVDFLVIGAHRSGTVWIDTCLGEHPEIYCSPVKEPSFFSNDAYYRCGKNIYLSLFQDRGAVQRIAGECSPDYLTTAGTAERIKRHFPNVKLIVCLRNPIERMYSHYLLKRSMGRLFEYPTFDQAFIRSAEGQRYLKLGRYAAGLATYLKLFGRDQVLTIVYEDIEKNPLKFIQRIYAFLGVSPAFVPSSANRRVNFYIRGNRVRSIYADRAILKCKPLLKRVLSTRNAAQLVRFLRWMNRKKNVDTLPIGSKPLLRNDAREYLIKEYAHEIVAVGRLINRDLRGLWN